MIILFGEQPSGLNTTGAGEHEAYHQRLTREQSRLQQAAERLVGLIYAQTQFRRREPPNWNIEWEPLWSPSEQEQAATAKAEADAKKAAVEAVVSLVRGGLATPDEGRALVREQIYETLPNTALPAEDDTEPQGEAETARKAGMDALTALLDSGAAHVDEVREMARRLFPDLPEGPAPEPEPLPTTRAEPDGGAPDAGVAAGEENAG
jgi:hypothetical protein